MFKGNSYFVLKSNLLQYPTFVINLKSRTDRKNHILNEFKSHPEFKLTVFNAIRAERGSQGLFLSIKNLVHDANQSREEYIIICEDDHIFTNNYDALKLKKHIKKGIALDYDILLGGPSNIHDAFFVEKDLVWVSGFSGFQFAVIFKRFYKKILSYDLPEESDFDLELGKISDNIYCCYPPISEQADFGYSDVTSKNNNINVQNYFIKCRNKLARLNKVFLYFKSVTN